MLIFGLLQVFFLKCCEDGLILGSILYEWMACAMKLIYEVPVMLFYKIKNIILHRCVTAFITSGEESSYKSEVRWTSGVNW